MIRLRQTLAGSAADRRFPTGEDWDFILPATPEEIDGGELPPVAVRRPKVEIVSFDTVSVPLIQVDYSVDVPYAELARGILEGLLDADRGSVWVVHRQPVRDRSPPGAQRGDRCARLA